MLLCSRLFEDERVMESPEKVFFAQLLPRRNGKTTPGLVQSILGPHADGFFQYSPGAKRIDVISRFMFPATFAGLNVIYWSYYLTKARTPLEWSLQFCLFEQNQFNLGEIFNKFSKDKIFANLQVWTLISPQTIYFFVIITSKQIQAQ